MTVHNDKPLGPKHLRYGRRRINDFTENVGCRYMRRVDGVSARNCNGWGREIILGSRHSKIPGAYCDCRILGNHARGLE